MINTIEKIIAINILLKFRMLNMPKKIQNNILWSRLYRKLYVSYVRNKNTIIIILLIILVLLLIYKILQSYLFPIPIIKDLNIDTLSRLTTIVRDIVYIAGAVLAATWSYYIFIKGRTFKPRLKIGINLKQICGEYRHVAIIRCSAINNGKINIDPLVVTAKAYRGYIDNDKLKYELFHEYKNILENYTDFDDKLSLEPGDEINIDFSLFVPNIKSENKHKALELVLIKINFIDRKYNVWFENSIIGLNDG